MSNFIFCYIQIILLEVYLTGQHKVINNFELEENETRFIIFFNLQSVANIAIYLLLPVNNIKGEAQIRSLNINFKFCSRFWLDWVLLKHLHALDVCFGLFWWKVDPHPINRLTTPTAFLLGLHLIHFQPSFHQLCVSTV